MNSRLTLLTLFAILTGLVACQKQEAPAPVVEETVLAPSLPKQITICSYEEYFANSVLEKFTQETGIEINYVACENTIEMRAYLKSHRGECDVLVADDVMCEEFARLGLIQPLDQSKIVGMKNLDPAFLNLDFDPNNRHTIPYLWGTTLIAYRTDWNASPERSWTTIMDPTSDVRIGWLNEANDIFGPALLALNHPANSENLEHLEAAADLMEAYVEAQRPMVGGLYEVLDALDAGNLDAVLTYSGDAALYAEDNDKIAYFIPEEGAPLWLDSFSLAADSPAEEEAYTFFNFLLRPEIAAENAQSLWYATPNVAAVEFLDPEFLADEGLWASESVRDLCVFTSKASLERDVILSRGMQKVMELIREQQTPSRVVTGPVLDESETFDPLPENYPLPRSQPLSRDRP